MLGDCAAYHEARSGGEPRFCEVLKSNGGLDVCQLLKSDDFKHRDVKCKFIDGHKLFGDGEVFFDVKQMTPSSAKWSSNYVLNNSLVDAIEADEVPEKHYLALELYGSDGKPDGRWLVVDSREAVRKCKFRSKSCGDKFWLISKQSCISLDKSKWTMME